MKKRHIIDRKGFVGSFVCLFCLLPMLLSGCGDGGSASVSSGSSETGSAIISVNWHERQLIQSLAGTVSPMALDCNMIGVSMVKAIVYASDGTRLAEGGPWDCTDHGGTIDGIPVGENRIVVILGRDAGGNHIYQGQKSGIAIAARPDNDVGVIDAYPFGPADLSAQAVSSERIDLVWSAANATVPPAGYRVYLYDALVGTTDMTTYSDTGLTPSTQYCYTVVAHDAMGNESAATSQACATTAETIDTEDPTVPTGLSATVHSSGQIDLAWNASSDNVGVVGYKIYRDGEEFDTSATLTYSDSGLVPQTEYCYAVAAYDEAGNLSAPCSAVCATTLTQSVWYHDADGDGYGDLDFFQSADTQPSGYVSNHTDCDDTNPSVHPGATEICDGIDNNCNGSTDEGLLTTFYEDKDGDGFGNPNSSIDACTQPNGFVTDSGDCNDGDSGVHPGAVEICNDGIDNDCNGQVDEAYLPLPELLLKDKQTFGTGAGSYTVYTLSVANLSAYPEELFVLSTAYPFCSYQESDGSRTVLEIYDSSNNLLSSEYCALTSALDLESFYLYVYSGSTSPEAVAISLVDRECDITSLSNLTVVAEPLQVAPLDDTSFNSNPGTTLLEWQPLAGAVSYGVEVQYDAGGLWSTLVANTGILTTTHTITFPYSYGRWRVWAIDSIGNDGPTSGWWYFTYP